MANDFFFPIPTVRHILLSHAKRHLENPIDFSRNGVICPENYCYKGPFPNTEILYLHILDHEEFLLLCRYCPQAFNEEAVFIAHFDMEHQKLRYLRNYMKLRNHIQLQNHTPLRIDILPLLSKKWNKLPVRPTFVDAPISCRYSVNASLVPICQFPQTGHFLTTKSEVTSVLKRCFEGRVFSEKMRCPIIREKKIKCKLEFKSCRELVLHITTHFDGRAVCIHCPQFYDNVDESFRFHMENIHNECIICSSQFGNLQSLNDHKSEIDALLNPYMNNPHREIDFNCALYFPNLAFHHPNTCMLKIDHEIASIEDHDCLKLSESLKNCLENVIIPKLVYPKVKNCLYSQVINYSERQDCCFAECSFQYSTCREVLVHILFKHSSKLNFTYVCDICLAHFAEKTILLFHFDIQHNHIACPTCRLSFTTNMSLDIHKYSTGHIRK